MQAIQPPGEGCTRLSVLLALLIATGAVVGTPRLAAQSVEDHYGRRLSLTSGSNLALTETVVANQPIRGGGTLLAPDAMAGGGQPGTFQPLQVDALFSWTGATSTTWATPTNWSPAGPPTGADTAVFNGAFSNQPNVTAATAVGELLMTDPVAQNVTLSSSGGGSVLTINGVGGTGILINNTNAFTLTISAGVALGGDQAWTNNSGNLFTDSGAVALGGHTLTVNGTGDTTISGAITGALAGSNLIKDGSGTLIVTASNGYNGTTTVNGGTLLVNGNNGDLGTGAVTVNGSGTTLGGNTNSLNNPSLITVNAGANLAPGTIGTAATLNIGSPLTLAAGSNFRVDLLGTVQGTSYDFLKGLSSTTFNFAGSNLVLHVGFATTTSETFTIVHSGGGFRGQQFAQGGFVLGDDNKLYSITYTGDSIILQWTGTIIPEPSTWIGGALVVAALGFTQRRRIARGLSRSRLRVRRLPLAT